MLCNIVLNLAFVWIWLRWDLAAPHAALALATSLAAYLNAALLFYKLRGTAALQLPDGWLKYLTQVMTATVVMGIALVWILPTACSGWTGMGQNALLPCWALCLSGLVLYIGALALLGVRKNIFVLQQ